jgi:hypothetical protein
LEAPVERGASDNTASLSELMTLALNKARVFFRVEAAATYRSAVDRIVDFPLAHCARVAPPLEHLQLDV